MGKHQVSFFINSDLWTKFNVKCAEKDVTKTEIFTKVIKDYFEKN